MGERPKYTGSCAVTQPKPGRPVAELARLGLGGIDLTSASRNAARAPALWTSRYGRRGAPGSPALHLLERTRPVLLEESREGAVGQDAAAILTLRAVVRLVRTAHDALYRRLAVRTRLAKLPVHGHAGMKSGHLVREAVAHFGSQALRPLAERRTRRVEERRHLLFRDPSRQLDGGQPRSVQDLVGVRVADHIVEGCWTGPNDYVWFERECYNRLPTTEKRGSNPERRIFSLNHLW